MISTLLVQDIIATLVAAGAVGIVVRRLAGLVRPSRDVTPCSTCGSCAPSVQERDSGVTTVVPLATLRRATREH